ncbi:MAG: hypothetical protein NUV77_14955 [Thermoguttaceae bacterium]|nr:hypothetical protein [Thermoguttaceae bacterium]
MIENPQPWPDALRRTLTFIERVLLYRFRYDIEVDEIQTIRPGEFDIEIE